MFSSLFNLLPGITDPIEDPIAPKTMKIVQVRSDGQRIPFQIPVLPGFFELRTWIYKQFYTDEFHTGPVPEAEPDEMILVVAQVLSATGRPDVVLWKRYGGDGMRILTGWDPIAQRFIDLDDSAPIEFPTLLTMPQPLPVQRQPSPPPEQHRIPDNNTFLVQEEEQEEEISLPTPAPPPPTPQAPLKPRRNVRKRTKLDL